MAFSVSLHRVPSTIRLAGRHRAAEPLPPLAKKERILGRCESHTGPAIATERGLLLGAGDGMWQRIGWPAVVSAAWSPIDKSLTVRLWPGDHDSIVQVRVTADQRFATIVRERVEYHRVLSVPVELVDGITGRVLALRDGDEIRWRVVADASLDTPALQRACAVAIAEIRSLAGL